MKILAHQKSYMQKSQTVERQWHLLDAQGKILGRLATEIAQLLIGKQKPSYTPHIDAGDYVVVINAAHVMVTGKKETDKIYYHHSGYLGGLKQKTLKQMRALSAPKIIEKAVKNMLPKNKLRSLRMNRLKVYAGSEHKHRAQIKE